MPLYPVVAVLIALVIERCSVASPEKYPRRAWHQFLMLSTVLIGGVGLVIGIGGLTSAKLAEAIYQPRWFCLVVAVAVVGAVYMLHKCRRFPRRFVPTLAVLTIAAFVGAAYAGIAINVHAERWNDPTHAIAELKRRLPPNTTLVSLTPIEHRFAYYYEDSIPELGWPMRPHDLPEGVDYFCFMRNPKDKPHKRFASRGRGQEKSSGMLPFAWEEITALNIERSKTKKGMTVVLGRIIRPIRAELSDATKPQVSTAARSETSIEVTTKARRHEDSSMR
jgi:hypothetical protein